MGMIHLSSTAVEPAMLGSVLTIFPPLLLVVTVLRLAIGTAAFAVSWRAGSQHPPLPASLSDYASFPDP